MPCITCQFDPSVGPVIDIGIAAPAAIKTLSTSGRPIVARRALVDTGASITCVTAEIAQQENLKLMGKRDTNSAHGTQPCNLYLADLAVPFGNTGSGSEVPAFSMEAIRVMEFVSKSPHFQILLGRDVLDRGLLTVSGFSRQLTLCL